MHFLQVEDDFAAAHQLREYKGRCENLHGHNWRVRIRVGGDHLNSLGMLMDFGDLKALVKTCLDELDHSFLNALSPFDAINPTSENLASHIFRRLGGMVPENIRLDSVTVWESEKCAAEYREI